MSLFKKAVTLPPANVARWDHVDGVHHRTIQGRLLESELKQRYREQFGDADDGYEFASITQVKPAVKKQA